MGRHATHDEEEGGGSHGAPHPHGAAHGGEHEEHEGAPEWLISFADNVMLMMGVFVILLALNMGKSSTQASSSGDDAGAQSEAATGRGGYSDDELDFAIAVREAFNNGVSVDSTDPADAALVRRLRTRAKATQGPGDDVGDPGSPSTAPMPVQSEQSNLSGMVSFAEMSAAVDEAGAETIAAMAPRFSGLRFTIELRGHASRWETMHEPERGYKLAFDRAEAVARVLVEHGVSWSRVRLVACGDAENGDDAGGGESGQPPAARVEIRLTSQISDASGRE